MRKIVSYLLLVLAISACSPLAEVMVKDEQVSGNMVATSGKATISFIRPGFHGQAIDSAVFLLTSSGEEFIGSVGYEQGVSISVPPGEHLFMATNQNVQYPRLMEAKLEAGKSYYAVVSPRGWPMIIFALVPVKNGNGYKYTHSELNDWLASTTWVKKSPAADEWFNKEKNRIHDARVAAYNDWLSSGQNMDIQFQLLPRDAYQR